MKAENENMDNSLPPIRETSCFLSPKYYGWQIPQGEYP
jgi:hypothetical protein